MEEPGIFHRNRIVRQCSYIAMDMLSIMPDANTPVSKLKTGSRDTSGYIIKILNKLEGDG